MAMRAFVGSLNRPETYPGAPKGIGITVLSFDPETGALQTRSETQGVDNPSFLSLAPDGRTLYATSEVAGWHEGVVTAYRVVGDRLLYVNKQATRGSIAAMSATDPTGRWLLVANYRLGEDGARPPQAVAVLPIEPDGGLGPVVHSVAHDGARLGVRSVDQQRQEGPHAHCVLSTPDGGHMLVADLGLDRIMVYGFASDGDLRYAGAAVMPPGCGPRHLAWAAPGLLVASGELANTATSLAWDGASLRPVAAASSLPPGFSGVSHASDIHAAPDGRFVYVANRGHDSIAVLALDPQGGLVPLAWCPTGATPRQFTLDPSGRFVLVACQDGHEVSVFRRDAASGRLSGPVARAAIGSPMCVALAAG